MKTYKKVIFAVLLLAVIVGSYIAHYIHRSYYPMGGTVSIIDKSEVGSKYYITIEEGTRERYKLSCSKEEFDQVDIGDTVNCDRLQSIVTHKGKVYRIRK